MATPNIVPQRDNEGTIGRHGLRWSAISAFVVNVPTLRLVTNNISSGQSQQYLDLRVVSGKLKLGDSVIADISDVSNLQTQLLNLVGSDGEQTVAEILASLPEYLNTFSKVATKLDELSITVNNLPNDPDFIASIMLSLEDAGFAQGPAGPAGPTGATGPAGADALWNFLGEYDNGYDYQVGDVVTYSGSTYYRYGEPNTGYPPTDTSYWRIVASKGAAGESNFWEYTEEVLDSDSEVDVILTIPAVIKVYNYKPQVRVLLNGVELTSDYYSLAPNSNVNYTDINTSLDPELFPLYSGTEFKIWFVRQ